MGEVKDAIKGEKKISPKLTEGNLITRLTELSDEISDLVAKKDEDALTEGADAKAENTRKAGLLRATSSLIRAAKNLLEDY